MKRHTRDTIRQLVQLVDRDVTELRDSVVQVDERTSAAIRRLDERVADIEAYLSAFDHDPHSRKA